MLEVPRVGQEVLVAFYGGNPDQPVIVGRVYNMTNTAAFPLPREKTKSGFRTESTGHTNSRSRGYNELVFEDKSAHEQVILRAEHSLRVLVKGSESHDVGGARSTHIGGNDAVHVGERSELLVGTQAGVRLTETSLLMSTTHAHLLLDGDTLDIQADGNVSFHAGKGVYISSNAGTVWLDGTPDINLNPQGGAGGPAPAASVLGPADGPGGGPEQPAPYRPEGTSKASPPLPAFPEVTLK
jgi:type VI secretion system secreted protein VgrG